MTKKNKALHISLVSALAATSVLTVAPSAMALSETQAQSISAAYNALDSQEKQIVNAVLLEVRNNIQLFIKTTDTPLNPTQQGQLASAFSAAMADIPDTTTAGTFENRFDTFVSSTSGYLGSSGTATELATFISNVSSQLIAKADQVDNSNLGAFANDVKNILTSNSTTAINQYIKYDDPGLLGLLDTIQTRVNAILNPAPGGGGGGTPPTPPVEESGGEVTAPPSAIEDNPQTVIDAIEKAEEVTELVVDLPTGTTNIAVPATIFNALEDKNEEAVVVVATEAATYTLPVNGLDLPALATQLGVTTPELFIFIEVKPAATQPEAVNGLPVVGQALEFTITVSTSQTPTAANSVEVTNFPVVVERSIVSSTAIFNPLTSTAGVLNDNGSFKVKPLFVEGISPSTGLGTEASIFSSTNSTYVVLSNFKTFVDVDGGKSWAEDYVERLASRMIVNGVNSTEFKPSNFITRGEFAALLSRGLGIEAMSSTDGKFTDVNTTQAAKVRSQYHELLLI